MILAILALIAQITLVPGTTNTWTDGKNTWAGNPGCNQIIGTGARCDGTTGPFSALLCAKSPAIDAGFFVTGFHCPNPGSALNQPKQADGSYCVEWYGKAPDIGSCEFYVAALPPLVCTVGNNTLTGCYYTDPNFGTLALVRDDGTSLNFDWGQGSPDPAIPPDNFSVKWEGNFSFLNGSYIFTITVDDGARLFVDGSLIIDAWIAQPPTTYTATQQMVAGTHDVRMEYFEATGGAVAKLNWTTVAVPLPVSPQNLTVTIQ
jgi:hypothetical protein